MCSYLSVSGSLSSTLGPLGRCSSGQVFDMCDGRSLEFLVWTSWYVSY